MGFSVCFLSVINCQTVCFIMKRIVLCLSCRSQTILGAVKVGLMGIKTQLKCLFLIYDTVSAQTRIKLFREVVKYFLQNVLDWLGEYSEMHFPREFWPFDYKTFPKLSEKLVHFKRSIVWKFLQALYQVLARVGSDCSTIKTRVKCWCLLIPLICHIYFDMDTFSNYF